MECIALDNSLAASSCLGGEIRVWNLTSGCCVQKFCRLSHCHNNKTDNVLPTFGKCQENDGLKRRSTVSLQKSLHIKASDTAQGIQGFGVHGSNGQLYATTSHNHFPEVPWSLAIRNKMLAVGYGDGVIEVSIHIY